MWTDKQYFRKLRGRFPEGRRPKWGNGYYSPAYYEWLYRTTNPKRPRIHNELEFNIQGRRLDEHKQWGYGYIKRKLVREFRNKHSLNL